MKKKKLKRHSIIIFNWKQMQKNSRTPHSTVVLTKAETVWAALMLAVCGSDERHAAPVGSVASLTC